MPDSQRSSWPADQRHRRASSRLCRRAGGTLGCWRRRPCEVASALASALGVVSSCGRPLVEALG